MRRVGVDEFTSNPFGAYVVGRCWLYFCTGEDLSGYLAWGRPEVADFDALTEMMPATHMPWSKPHASLVDVTAMDGIAAQTFERIVRFAIGNSEPIRKTVTKFALVRTMGIASAVASGFFSFVPDSVPFSFFDATEGALDWVGRKEDLPLFELLHRERSLALGGSPLVEDVRRVLETAPDLALSVVAKRLAVSERTLQRRLGEAGTTLRREAGHARIRAAERLLVDSDTSLTEIAHHVGCSSAQHFSSLFRSVHAATPSVWRQRQRAVS